MVVKGESCWCKGHKVCRVGGKKMNIGVNQTKKVKHNVAHVLLDSLLHLFKFG